ncbi:MAG TPA: Uma2 family endonuclease [Pyrinomonadaceae bacterium]|nr:Uma2 family endonuclease [Pyrinomonadaceae bacterium]
MSTSTQLMTAEELLRLPRGKSRYELVKGELKTMSPAGEEHGVVIMNLAVPLGHYIKANDLGVIYGAETGFKIATNPDTVRAPDIAFVRRERIEQSGIQKGFRPGAPDLAVEVVSPGDTFEEVDQKVEDWLKAGTGAVWIVNPKLRTVTIYQSLTEVTVLSEKDELEGQRVVPGFRCKVSEIFV